MCSSEELIHDARQITLEEMIMTNETPMYLVLGRLTVEQVAKLLNCWDGDENTTVEKVNAALAAIGTPIQPCADVETVGWLDPALMDALRVRSDTLLGVTLANIETPTRNIPLVRRTDMNAQVSRVAAEKDAEIARLRDALFGIDVYAGDTLSGPDVGPIHEKWLKVGVQEIRHRARAALNEGAAE